MDPDILCTRSLRDIMLVSLVSIPILPKSFTYPSGNPHLVRSFVVLDVLAKKFGAAIWQYKIMAWNEQAEKLNMIVNILYRFTNYSLKPTSAKTTYSGQGIFDVHLT